MIFNRTISRYRKDGSIRYSLCERGKLPVGKEKIEGVSMEPTIHDGDIVTIVSYKMFKPRIDRGDILVLDTPSNAKVVIKRCIAVPGDYVKSTSKISEAAVVPAHMWRKGAARMGFHRLKADEIFVEGDNTRNSYDSRYYGPLKLSNILGVVIRIKHKDGTRERLYTVTEIVDKSVVGE